MDDVAEGLKESVSKASQLQMIRDALFGSSQEGLDGIGWERRRGGKPRRWGQRKCLCAPGGIGSILVLCLKKGVQGVADPDGDVKRGDWGDARWREVDWRSPPGWMK